MARLHERDPSDWVHHLGKVHVLAYQARRGEVKRPLPRAAGADGRTDAEGRRPSINDVS